MKFSTIEKIVSEQLVSFLKPDLVMLKVLVSATGKQYYLESYLVLNSENIREY